MPDSPAGPASASPDAEVGRALARAHRQGWASLVGGLTRRYGDLHLAEDAAADAYAAALQSWPSDGVPARPLAWLTTTARRKAIDRLRRDARGAALQEEAATLRNPHLGGQSDLRDGLGIVDDDRLRLLFTCCHPVVPPEARIALTLRLVGGLTVAEIARAFLVGESAMQRRLTRAKAAIRTAAVPFRLPDREDLPVRRDAVLRVIYLIFNEGYLAGGGDQPVRADLCDEAVRLARLLHHLLPEDGEVSGLLSLLLLTDARRPSRVDTAGQLVRLDAQDRSRWDDRLLRQGRELIRARIASGQPPGPYQLQAAIAAVHTWPADARDTDWHQVLSLYDDLARMDPSPVVALNRAVALAEVQGPALALEQVDRLPLQGYHAWHATRADLLRRLHRPAEAWAAYGEALRLTGNPAEIAHLTRRRADLDAAGAAAACAASPPT